MNTPTIAIIGLGYVGLPLAAAFAKKYPVIGFDINKPRVAQLQEGFDMTLELSEKKLKSVIVSSVAEVIKTQKGLFCTTELNDIASANI